MVRSQILFDAAIDSLAEAHQRAVQGSVELSLEGEQCDTSALQVRRLKVLEDRDGGGRHDGRGVCKRGKKLLVFTVVRGDKPVHLLEITWQATNQVCQKYYF